MKSSHPHPSHPRHVHEPTAAAATAVVHDDPHTTESPPTTLDLTDEQKATLAGLDFKSAYEIAHTTKASPDVAAAFDAASLTTIENHPELGGEARVALVRKLVDLHNQLVAIAAVVAPILRLVGQNLMSVDGQLAQNVGEPLRVAHALHRSQPAILEGLASLDTWSRAHHNRGTGKTPEPTPNPTPPTS